MNKVLIVTLIHACVFLPVTRPSSVLNDGKSSEYSQSVLKAGEEYYRLTTTYSQMPVYGVCWKKPLESLPVACGNLTEAAHKWLALTFTNCFLLQSHQKPHPCVEPTQDNIGECLEMGMDDRVFTTYNSFFIHTHNMCYFLKSQIWQEETRKTVFQLMDASQRVVENMESQLKIQQQIHQNQEQALQDGFEMRKELDLTIARSKEIVQVMLDEIQKTSGQQIAIFDEIAHSIVKLRALFFGELVGVYTVLYYFFVVIISYFLTSCKRLESARLWLYVVFTLSLAFERAFSNYGLEESTRMFSDQLQATVYARVWFLRKTTLGVGIVILFVSGWRYRNYIDIMCELQKDNLQARKELLSLIEIMRQDSPVKKSPARQHQDFRFDRALTDDCKRTQSTPSKAKITVKASPMRELSPVVEFQPRGASPYNLRSRSRSPAVFNQPLNESPSKFAEFVTKSADASSRRSLLIRQQLKAAKVAFTLFTSTNFSSDED